jgi:hypothetical protein
MESNFQIWDLFINISSVLFLFALYCFVLICFVCLFFLLGGGGLLSLTSLV